MKSTLLMAGLCIVVSGPAFAETTAPADLKVERRKPWPDLGMVSVGLYRHPDGLNSAGQRLADHLLASLERIEQKMSA